MPVFLKKSSKEINESFPVSNFHKLLPFEIKNKALCSELTTSETEYFEISIFVFIFGVFISFFIVSIL